MRPVTIITITILALAFLSPADQATTAAQEGVSYSRVEAILRARCIACHSHTSRTSGLDLESHAGVMNGGRRGAAIIAGNGGESLLVRYIDGTLQPRMPPGEQLSAAEIDAIKAWIDAGAPGPLPAAPGAATAPVAASLPDISPTVAIRPAVSSLALQPAGQLIALGIYQEVELVSGSGLSVARFAGLTGQVRGLAFSPDGRLLAAAGGSPGQFGEIRISNVADKREVVTVRGHHDNIFAVAFSPDGGRLATCSYDRTIILWDAASGRELRTLKDHTDAVFSIAFSHDGKLLASASADRTIKLWDAASGERLYTLGDGLDAMHTVAFHPSRNILAGAGADRVIRIWEVGEKEGRQLRSLIAHEDAINHVIFSPDGRTLASTGADRSIRLWDATAATITEIRVLERQPDQVQALAFTPDGRGLVAGRYDGSVFRYDTVTGKGEKIR